MTEGARIVGLGNADRGDDAAGLLVARRLRELGVESAAESGDPLSLIESFGQTNDLIIVDAVITGATPGTIRCREVGPDAVATLEGGETSTHGLGVAQAIELARILNRLPQQIRIYGIEGRCFEIGAPPSREVLAAVESLAQQLSYYQLRGRQGGRRPAFEVR
ncbi:MAG TPA: hydrogenase maturation protease [Pyrinomonadaceae bacterium]|nr:hydrogenase maturation protease [Pyrinomonadaceae bacterium]